MADITTILESNEKEETFRAGTVLLFIISVTVTLTAVFGVSGMHTATAMVMQHVLIFLGGIGAGAAVTTTFKSRRAK